MIESFSAGSLVIASDIPPFKEIGRNNAIFFKNNSINDLLEKVSMVLKKENNKFFVDQNWKTYMFSKETPISSMSRV